MSRPYPPPSKFFSGRGAWSPRDSDAPATSPRAHARAREVERCSEPTHPLKVPLGAGPGRGATFAYARVLSLEALVLYWTLLLTLSRE